jgi:hypothetical protein
LFSQLWRQLAVVVVAAAAVVAEQRLDVRFVVDHKNQNTHGLPRSRA